MNNKKIVLSSILLGAFVSVNTFATNYPVQPVNNGIAKKVIEYIYEDEGLAKRTTAKSREIAAKSANAMSEIILKSIKETKIAEDGFISKKDVKLLNDYMYRNYHNQMLKYHGDDERINGKKVETGFHKVVNNGGVMRWKIPVKKEYKKVNRVADGIFHLGLYKTVNNRRILNEDGKKNVKWKVLARTLYVLLKDDLNLKFYSKKLYKKLKSN